MATQYKIQFSEDNGSTWIDIAQPDALGYSFETTYTEDSGRVQSGTAKVGQMYTVEAFYFRYADHTRPQAHTHNSTILKGEPFMMRYPSVYYNGWRTGKFYVGKGSANWGRINVDEELVENLEFNTVGVDPVGVDPEGG